jgi:hypothetical protein
MSPFAGNQENIQAFREAEARYGALPQITETYERPFINGMAVGLYPGWERGEYVRALNEIAAINGDSVSLVVSWVQQSVESESLAPHLSESVSDNTVLDAIALAHQTGLKVLLFPIVRLLDRRPDQWRGELIPSDIDAWFSSYEAFVLHYARMAEEEGVALFSVGSELGSMEQYEQHWRRLISNTRAEFSGELIYSANWDHYLAPDFWDAVDYIGLTGYYELVESRSTPVNLSALTDEWREIRDELIRFVNIMGQPLLFTEVGYASQRGAAWHPWDYTQDDESDWHEQYICYRAFYEAWRNISFLSGVFFWNWYGSGGLHDNSYTPRRKPAEGVIRHWYGQTEMGVESSL